MKLVKQEKFGQCGPACVATVLGMGLQEVLEDFDTSEGVHEDQIVEYLADNGVVSMVSSVWPAYSVKAILTVPSLNHPGFLHMIIWDGERYLDPSPGPLVYPDDSPINENTGEKVPPQWATAILLLGGVPWGEAPL
jgi:hypothetical protein